MEDDLFDIDLLINELIISLCDCNECDNIDCNDSAFVKYGLYMSLTGIDYSDTITALNTYFKSRNENLYECIVYNEKYKGVTDTSKSAKILLSLYYLTLYFEEYNSAEDQVSKDEVNTKFNFDSVSVCIEKLAIDIDTIKTLFTDV